MRRITDEEIMLFLNQHAPDTVRANRLDEILLRLQRGCALTKTQITIGAAGIEIIRGCMPADKKTRRDV